MARIDLERIPLGRRSPCAFVHVCVCARACVIVSSTGTGAVTCGHVDRGCAKPWPHALRAVTNREKEFIGFQVLIMHLDRKYYDVDGDAHHLSLCTPAARHSHYIMTL